MNLAHIGRIIEINPIANADLIETATVVCGKAGKWIGVTKKGEYQPGDITEVYMQDALLPKEERFAFMERHGYRVKITKLRGANSECLIMPLSEVTQGMFPGEDIEELIGVKKYIKYVPAHLAGDMAGPWPGFIPKTDEPNFQRVPEMVNALRGKECYVTIKADGSSGTVFWLDGALHCCSRNWEMQDKPGTAVWQIARRYKLEDVLKDTTWALQFEMVGPKIQGNPLGLEQVDMRLFQVWDWDLQKYLDLDDFLNIAEYYGLPTVELVDVDWFDLEWDDEGLRELANQKYPNGRAAEGIVIRPTQEARVEGERVSFKVINPLYKEKE